VCPWGSTGTGVMAPERMSVDSLANEVDVEILSLDLPGRMRLASGKTASLHWEFDLRSSWLDFFFKKREMPLKNIHFCLEGGDDNVLGALELSTSEAGNSLHIAFSLKNSGIEPRCKPEHGSTPPLDLRW